MGDPGSNWKIDEEVQLCASHARITTCSITGNSQSLPKLWEKVHADYKENWEGDQTRIQTPQALQSHFRHLKTTLKEWHNALQLSRARRASGTNSMDEYNQAQSIFCERNKGKPFDKGDCWNAIKHHQTFKDVASSPQPLTSFPTFSASETEFPIDLDDDEVLEMPSNSSARPMGRKAAKEVKRKGRKVQETSESIALAIQSLAESSQATVELIKKIDGNTQNYVMKVLELEEAKEDAKIMVMDTSVMSPPSKAWWKKRKGDIVKKTMQESGSSDCYIPQFEE